MLRAANPPLTEHVVVWQRAIPQYNLGHPHLAATLKQLCAANPGIFLTGNYLGGPAIPACIDEANRSAEDAARFVQA